MSETAPERTETSSPAADAPVQMVAVRRRRRQKRTEPVDWRRIVVLIVVFIFGLVLVLDKKLTGIAKTIASHLSGAIGGIRVEIIVLGLCGLIWLYLTPGVEERLLNFLKAKRTRRSRRHR